MTTSNSLRIGLYGSGRAAAEILRALPSNITLTSAVVFLKDQAGEDIGTLTGGEPIGIIATDDLTAAVTSGAFDTLLYAGLSGPTLDDAMTACATAGVDMVHASHMNPRISLDTTDYERLQSLATASGARIVGTGILPGFWLDVLPATLMSAMPAPVSIRAESRADLSTWGAGVLGDELGLGQPMDDEPAPVALLLRESAGLLGELLGLPETPVDRGGFVGAPSATSVAGIDIATGSRIGFDQSAVVTHDGIDRVRVVWKAFPASAIPDYERGLSMTITGGDGQEISLDALSAPDPYPGTAARFLHAARAVRDLPAGLRTPVELRP